MLNDLVFKPLTGHLHHVSICMYKNMIDDFAVHSKTGSRNKEDVEREIAELKKRWPPHSVKPAMMARLEELEAELRDIEANRAQTTGSS